MNTYYIYRSHMEGNLWSSEVEIDYDSLYCEQCNDADDYLGAILSDTEPTIEMMMALLE